MDAPVSPVAISTCLYDHDDSGLAHLKLLVLWPGTPGWFMKGNSGGSSGGSSGRQQLETISIRKGDLSLNLRFDAEKHLAWIGDREVALQDDNVILVDTVDGAAGPQVVRTL